MIILKNIDKAFKKTHALKNINLELPTNEIYGLIGANGSGKSTLIDIIAGLTGSYKGNVIYNGIKREDIAYVSNNINFSKNITVGNAISMFADFKEANTTQKKQLINELELRDQLQKKISELSQGNKQRVNIALALLGKPEYIILDEPNNSLDPDGFMKLRKIILTLKQKEIVVLISSHILSEIELICDRIVFLNEGNVKINDDKRVIIEKYGSLEAAYMKASAK